MLTNFISRICLSGFGNLVVNGTTFVQFRWMETVCWILPVLFMFVDSKQVAFPQKQSLCYEHVYGIGILMFH